MINKIPVYSSSFCFSYPSLLFFYRFVPLSFCCFRSFHHALLLFLSHFSFFLCFFFLSFLFFYRFVPLSCCCFRSLHHALLLLLAHSSVFLCLCLSCRPNPSLLFRL